MTFGITVVMALGLPWAPASHADHGPPGFSYDGSLVVSASFFGRISEQAWLTTGESSLNGVDADIVELPDWAPGHHLTVRGSSSVPYDLDVWFYNNDRSGPRISSCVFPPSDPQCLVPARAKYAAVVANRGAPIDFTLEVASPVCPGRPVNDPNYLEPELGNDGTAAVVAVIDTGINFLHDDHARADLAGFGNVPVRAVDTTTGEGARFLPIDRSLPLGCNAWVNQEMQPRVLYRADGTNAFYISFADEAVDGFDRNGHGSAVSGAVVREGPDVLVVGVQVSGSSDFFRSAAEGLAWAAAQPWIDIITLSIAPSGNVTAPGPFLEASRAAHEAGKLVFFAAGNSPEPTWHGDSAGPPWVVSVGGADPFRHGEAVLPSRFPDVVGDFTRYSADAASYEDDMAASGTSLAAPSVAGAVAQGLHLARLAVGHTGPMVNGHLIEEAGLIVHASDLRHAMNRNAVYWEPTEYDPAAEQPYEPGFEYVLTPSVPVNPVAPWLQMGWGYVNGEIAQAIAETLLTGRAPEKPLGAVAFMEARQATRAALWS